MTPASSGTDMETRIDEVCLKEPTPADNSPVPFDFRRIDPIPKSQFRGIRLLSERFTRSVASTLTVYLRCEVFGALISVRQWSFGEFAASLGAPTCMGVLRMEPADSYAVLEISELLFPTILDLVLGGTGKIKMELGREITEVEESMMSAVFRVIALDLSETWSSTLPARFTLDHVETKPQAFTRISNNETVAVMTVELRIAEVTGVLNIAVPWNALEETCPNPGTEQRSGRSQSRELEAVIKARLSRELMVDVCCEVLGCAVPLGELLQLKASDLIDLGVPFDNATTLVVNGTPRFKGRVSASGRVFGVKIENAIRPSNI